MNRANNAANYISISLLGVIWAVRITFPLQDIIVALATVGIQILQNSVHKILQSKSLFNELLVQPVNDKRIAQTSVRDSIGFHTKKKAF